MKIRKRLLLCLLVGGALGAVAGFVPNTGIQVAVVCAAAAVGIYFGVSVWRERRGMRG